MSTVELEKKAKPPHHRRDADWNIAAGSNER